MAGRATRADLPGTLAGAMAARARGDGREAAALLARARKIAPDHPDVLHVGAILAHDAGRGAEALRLVDRALSLRPGDARLLRSRGLVCAAMGRACDAIDAFRAALASGPADSALARQLAALLREAGDVPGAIAALRAVPTGAQDFELRFDLANLLREAGDVAAALPLYERLAYERPRDVASLSNLAACLARAGRDGEASQAFARALALPVAPADGARLARAAARFHEGRGDRAAAIRLAETAVSLEPDVAGHRLALADLLAMEFARVAAGTWHQTRALQILVDPSAETLASNSIAPINLDECGEMAARAGREHGRDIAAGVASAIKPRAHAAPAVARSRLRVGYVSPDFRRHAVANFALPLVEAHDRDRVEVVGFSLSSRMDDVTSRFEAAFDRWTRLDGVNDDEAAATVRAAGIDVLVDLAGMTADSRPGIFLRRPAPVQVTYLGYAGTTGLDCFDARIVDAISDPPGMTDALFSEPLVRLQGPFLAYRPVDPAPEPDPEPPLARAGVVTFGCFGNFAKITQQMLAIWRRVLDAVPGSRLLLKNSLGADPVVVADLERMARSEGMSGRLAIASPEASTQDHLRAYGRVDIALDTFPYGGTTTTFEALWMGVPVVTLCGRPHASRVGASILHHAGLGAMVASDPSAYARICVDLASDPSRLAGWRAGLRSALAASSACDAPGLARRLESAYVDLWRGWCDRTLVVPLRT